MIRPGDVILARVPQADGGDKLRPALVLCALPGRSRDLLVSGISSQLHHRLDGWDALIRPVDASFAATGLRAASIVRLSFLASLPPAAIEGGIGRVEPKLLDALQRRLARHLRRSRPA